MSTVNASTNASTVSTQQTIAEELKQAHNNAAQYYKNAAEMYPLRYNVIENPAFPEVFMVNAEVTKRNGSKVFQLSNFHWIQNGFVNCWTSSGSLTSNHGEWDCSFNAADAKFFLGEEQAVEKKMIAESSFTIGKFALAREFLLVQKATGFPNISLLKAGHASMVQYKTPYQSVNATMVDDKWVLNDIQTPEQALAYIDMLLAKMDEVLSSIDPSDGKALQACGRQVCLFDRLPLWETVRGVEVAKYIITMAVGCDCANLPALSELSMHMEAADFEKKGEWGTFHPMNTMDGNTLTQAQLESFVKHVDDNMFAAKFVALQAKAANGNERATLMDTTILGNAKGLPLNTGIHEVIRASIAGMTTMDEKKVALKALFTRLNTPSATESTFEELVAMAMNAAIVANAELKIYMPFSRKTARTGSDSAGVSSRQSSRNDDEDDQPVFSSRCLSYDGSN
jgi:hypothetical protein